MQPVDRVPVRVLLRQCPPLATRRRDPEDRIHDLSAVHRRWTAHFPRSPQWSDQIRDQIPFFIADITMRCPPCHDYRPGTFRHQRILSNPTTRHVAINPTTSKNYPNSV